MPYRGRPSATTSSVVHQVLNIHVKVPHKRIGGDSSHNPASCTLVAKGVKKMVTPAEASRKGDGGNRRISEELRLDAGVQIGRSGGQRHASACAIFVDRVKALSASVN